MRISVQNLSKSYGGKDILSDFSLEIYSRMHLCVCGHNGSGKSTFLRLLAGEEVPDGGRVVYPKGCRIGYVQQELRPEQLAMPLLEFVVDVLPDWNVFWKQWEQAVAEKDEIALAALSARQAELEQQYGYNPENTAKTVLSGLGFAPHKWHLSLQELSGGWRERAKLARVLTAGADVLLLDEPTNHLDLEAVEWLESFLLDYQGVLVFVAHDRVFMDKVGTHILYCSGNGKPLFRRGTFSQFIALQEETNEQRAREAARVQEEIERKMDFVRRFKAKATKARQAASRQKMAKRLEKELEGLQPEVKRRELEFSWPQPAPSDRVVLTVTDLMFSFPDGGKMWDSLSFSLYRGQKIALVGPNGCGKSTLLRLIAGRLEKAGGEISLGQQVRMGYFSQHQLDTLNAEGTVLGEIRRLSDPRTTEEELMSVLGLFLLGQPFFDRQVSSLSGGEKSRLMLATLFLGRYNFLVLDEPTNHLDLESREALVEALESYEGTVLMVAHDRHLLSEVAEQIWALEPSGFAVYEHGFEDYVEDRRKKRLAETQLEQEEKRNALKRTSGLSREDMKRLKREQAALRQELYRQMKPLQQRYSMLENKLEATLAKQATVESVLADPVCFQEGSQATVLLKEYHALQQESDQLLEELGVVEAELAALEERKAELSED